MNPQKIESLFDIAHLYDTIFTDMYGVIWGGEAFYDGVLDVFERLKQTGKKIYIISNATTVGSIMREKVQTAGLILNQHYDGVITSGDTLMDKLTHGFFRQIGRKPDYKFYVIGRNNPMLFWNEIEHQVYDIKEADFVYISSLIIDGVYPTSLEAFIPELQKALDRKLPAVCANPDFFAFYNDLKYYTGGSAARWYQDRGGLVHWIGKPYPHIFDYALKTTRSEKSKTVMIGDTLRTDIVGAADVGLDSILITGQGITYDELLNGKTLEECYADAHVCPTYLLDKI